MSKEEPRRSDKRIALANLLLPKVEDYVIKYGFNSLNEAALVSGKRWYTTKSNAFYAYKNWQSGNRIPEFWVMETYSHIVENLPPVISAIRESHELNDGVIEQVEEALSITDLPKSKQYEILAIVARGLESA